MNLPEHLQDQENTETTAFPTGWLCTVGAKVTVGKTVGALACIKQWHQTVLTLVAFLAITHYQGKNLMLQEQW